MRFERLPEEKQENILSEAYEINALVDQWLIGGKEAFASVAADAIIKEREKKDAYTKEFGNGWAEMMERDSLAKHRIIKAVEDAPRETNDDRKTDLFVHFINGDTLGVQFTLLGFEERGNVRVRKNLEEKLADVIRQDTVTYFGKQQVPLTMTRGEMKIFSDAFAEWEASGREGEPADYIPQRETEKSIEIMANVLERKGQILHQKTYYEYAGRIKRLLQETARP